MIIEATEVFGLSGGHLLDYRGQRVHRAVLQPLDSLVVAAAQAGFQLTIASAYRSFARQQRIWNEKATGLRPLFADDGSALEFSALSEEQKLYAILRWSALPGASRHHWGTDFDVYDASALAPNQQVQLTVAETAGEGVFAPMHRWLDGYLSRDDSEFFRPYAKPTGGVAPEPWHLSFAPISAQMQQQLQLSNLHGTIMGAELELKELVVERLAEIYQRYIWVPWERYPEKFRPRNANNI